MDPSGNVIVGAAVTLVNESTGDQRVSATDVTGGFVFPSLLPGLYTVRTESPGFQRYQRTGNTLTANERLSLGNLQLTIGSVSEQVTVSAQGATVQTASAEVQPCSPPGNLIPLPSADVISPACS